MFVITTYTNNSIYKKQYIQIIINIVNVLFEDTWLKKIITTHLATQVIQIYFLISYMYSHNTSSAFQNLDAFLNSLYYIKNMVI